MISILCYHNDDNNSHLYHKHKTEINGDKQEEKKRKNITKRRKERKRKRR